MKDRDKIEEIDALFYRTQPYLGGDEEVIITIRAKASQVCLESFADIDQNPYKPLNVSYNERMYYRINLRDVRPIPGKYVMTFRYPERFTYYKHIESPQSTKYYRRIEGKKMQFFIESQGTWRNSVYADAESFNNMAGVGALQEIDFKELPVEIKLVERDCE